MSDPQSDADTKTQSMFYFSKLFGSVLPVIGLSVKLFKTVKLREHISNTMF